jgi:hypothetical protein
MNYVETQYGQTMSNELAVEQEELATTKPQTDSEWAEWYERTGNFWSKWTRQGYGDGFGSARHAFVKAEQYREKSEVRVTAE